MIEAALYFALGALSVGLLLFVILPIVSGRARRLAIHELERQAPVSLSEITAQKDQMRARFAVELNRQEKRADQLQVESQQHLVTAEKWRIFAERVEQEFEKLKNDYASLKQKVSSAEVSLEKQREIAKSALKTMTGQEKKRLFELEDEVEELRAEKSAANVRLVAMQTEVNNAKSRVAEMERHMPSLEELNLRKELKALAEDVSAFVKSAPPPQPAPVKQPTPFVQPVAANPAPEAQLEPEVAPAQIAAAQSTPEPAPEIKAPEPETPQEDNSIAAMEVIPAFLKPVSERQQFDRASDRAVPETATEIASETVSEAPSTLQSEKADEAGFQFGASQPSDEPEQPQTARFSDEETTPSEPRAPLGEASPAPAAFEPVKPSGTAAAAPPMEGIKDATLPNAASEKATEPVPIASVGSGKRIKSDKPARTKKTGFAGMIAAVSRGNKGALSSGTNGKVKTASVHSSSKITLKNGAASLGTPETLGLNGAKPLKAALEPAGLTAKDDGAAARKQRKIGKFGKKMRRGKAATASS